jgi:FMN phosphatase YigB (HAD superfamily)
MINLSEKVILVDADGVLLDWLFAFDNWMYRHGYTIKDKDAYRVKDRYEYIDGKWFAKVFNESAWIRKLPPHRDAIKWVKKLHEDHGYVFHVISSLSDDEYAQHLRTKNLRELFGDSAFERYTYLDTGADKDLALSKYAETECWWIEDKPENADLGIKLGLRSVLMNHEHNKESELHEDVIRVNNWKEIYELITGA